MGQFADFTTYPMLKYPITQTTITFIPEVVSQMCSNSYCKDSSTFSLFPLFNMEDFSGSSLFLDTTFPVLRSILLSRRGPDTAIAKAPIGAVIMIERTAMVRTLVPRLIRWGSPNLMAASRANPPIAAYKNPKRWIHVHFTCF